MSGGAALLRGERVTDGGRVVREAGGCGWVYLSDQPGLLLGVMEEGERECG